MKPGDLYNRYGKTYMVIDLFERSWPELSEDGIDLLTRAVLHVSCMSPDGFEEFPLNWFCRDAEAVNEDSP